MAARFVQLGLFCACVTVFWAGGMAAYKSSRFATCSKAAAWERVKDGVRRSLVAPRAAEFPALAEVEITRAGSCAFHVRGYVDAVNLHGVFLRADLEAQTHRTETGAFDIRLDRLETRAAPVPQILPQPAQSQDAARPAGGPLAL